MKTQKEIDALRAEYKTRWDQDIRRKEAKRTLYRASLDAVNEALLNRDIRVLAGPGETYPGDALATQINEFEEDIAWRKVQWEIIVDEWDAVDSVRKSNEPA